MDTDILIIGGGIAGPALAAALADTDLSITLLERRDDPLDTARGDHMQPRSVASLAAWGVLPKLTALGAERRETTLWFSQQGELLIDASVSELDLPYPYFLFLNHERIGQALMSRACENSRFTMISPIKNWSAIDLEGGRHTVEVTQQDGTKIELRPQLVVGADGRASGVRKRFDLPADVQRYQRPINVLFGKRLATRSDTALRVHIVERGILAEIPRISGGVKIGVASSAQSVGYWRDASPKERSRQLDLLVAHGAAPNLQYGGVYPPTRTVSRHWTGRQVVIIGDACHALHPAQSQGMNLTFRCVASLASELRKQPQEFQRAIETYEAKVRPGIEQAAAANHRAGVLYDEGDSDSLEAFAQMLRATNADKDKCRAYAMRTAGFPNT